jgi:hypothetical protein
MLEHVGVFRIDMSILTMTRGPCGGIHGPLATVGDVFAYAPTLVARCRTVDDTWGKAAISPDLLEPSGLGTDVVQLRSGDCIAVGEIRIDPSSPMA